MMGFDFSSLKTPTTFGQGILTKKIITTIPIRKPRNIDFFRIKPDTPEEKWKAPAFILDMGSDEEKYLVGPEVLNEAISLGRVKSVTLYYGITWPDNVVFVSDIPWPDAEGKDNLYNKTRRIAYELAETRWIKIQSNKASGHYDILEAVSGLPEPEWPEDPATIGRAAELAFGDNFIDSHEHPVLKRLRGEL